MENHIVPLQKPKNHQSRYRKRKITCPEQKLEYHWSCYRSQKIPSPVIESGISLVTLQKSENHQSHYRSQKIPSPVIEARISLVPLQKLEYHWSRYRSQKITCLKQKPKLKQKPGAGAIQILGGSATLPVDFFRPSLIKRVFI